MKDLGKKIRALRQEKGWTQGDVAVKLNITVAAFSKIETQVTDVSLSRIEELAEIFKVSIVELLGLEVPGGQNNSNTEELKQAKETIDRLNAKISHLQEYVITLYEELHKSNAEQKK